jgi:kynureninase
VATTVTKTVLFYQLAELLKITTDQATVTLLTWTHATDIVASGVDSANATLLSTAFIAELQRRVTGLITPNMATLDKVLAANALLALVSVNDWTGQVSALGSVANGVTSLVLSGFIAGQNAYATIALPHSSGSPFI